MSWYRTGTVAVTNGSKNVTGVGTLWTTAVNAGDAFALVDANLNPTGAWYEIDVVVSNTEITLKQSYAGTTGSNKQYCVFNLVGNMTTPSFAQRLATFFASFQSLIDKPTTTPTAASIPIADSGGKIDSAWIKDASTTVKGVVELATNEEAAAESAISTTHAVTPSGARALLRKYGIGATGLNQAGDVDNFKTSGLYGMNNASTNLPGDGNAVFLEVLAHGPNFIVQRALRVAGGDIAFSRYWNGTTWTTWTPIPIGTTPKAQTFAVTSTDDATSATAAPLKSAGGLAVAKKGIFGQGIGFGNSSTSSPDVTGTTKVRKIQVFDASGNSIGYLQVYEG